MIGVGAFPLFQVQTITVLPGKYYILIQRQNAPSVLDFTVSAQDQVTVDPNLSPVMQQTGSNQFILLP